MSEVTPETVTEISDIGHELARQTFMELSDDEKWALIYQSQVSQENKLDNILTIMSKVADAANNFTDNIPPAFRAMLGM
jgi:hypothetical protein